MTATHSAERTGVEYGAKIAGALVSTVSSTNNTSKTNEDGSFSDSKAKVPCPLALCLCVLCCSLLCFRICLPVASGL